MSEKIQAQAKCLCEKVSIEARSMDNHFHACHCDMCRTWGGGPLLSARADSVNLVGEEFIKIYNSSDWAERGFCTECGTHLFYRTKSPEVYMLPIGLMKPQQSLKFKEQYFIDKKDSNYEFSNQTENLTREEVFKRFS